MSNSSFFSLKLNFTKSGAAKRTFTPTIPSKRNNQSSSSNPQSHDANQKDLNVKSCNKTKNRRVKKEWIQIQPTFNGIDDK